MKAPEIKIQAISSSGREASFSTKTITKGQIPRILNEFKSVCAQERKKCVAGIQDKLKKLEVKIDDWAEQEDPKSQKKHLESKINSFLNFSPEKYRTKLKAPYDDYKKRENNYLDFKRQNNLSQEPLRAGFKTWAWGFLLILFGIELYANYQLFQGVTGTLTEAGKRTAWTLSGAQSFVNVFSGFLVGWLVWGKIIYAKELRARLFAFGLSLVHAAVVLWMNLGIGLYRAILSSNAQGGIQKGVLSNGEPNMVIIESWRATTPFNPEHFFYFNGQWDSLLVALVGVVFALVAYTDGWFSDDPHPQYGARSREVLKARKILDDTKNDLYEKWEVVVKNYNNVIDKFSKDALISLRVWNDSINEIEKQFVDWEEDISVAEKKYILAIETYETAFNQGLTKSAEKISLPRNPLFDIKESDPFKVFKDAKEHHMCDAERKKAYKAKKSDFVNEFNKLTEEWQKYQKETFSSINKLVKEFDV